MSSEHLQDILPFIEQPSRYLGTEINTVKKDPLRVDLAVALAFPDLYEIGMSHFGIRILYSILNGCDNILAERVFAPAKDMEALLRKQNRPLMSLESGRAVNTFDMIGFSLLYELNYTNMLNMMDLAGIPFLSRDRNHACPLIIGGGPCTSNPEPVADFFDAMVIGDGDRVMIDIAKQVIIWKKRRSQTKTALLEALAKIHGVYIPGFFKTSSGGHWTEYIAQPPEPLYDQYRRIKRAVVGTLETAPFPESPIVPFGKPVHDRLRLEVSRGCSRACRFCQAGMIYRPVRERSPENLLEMARKSLDATGYEEVSLLSLSTGDYSCLDGLMQALMGRCYDRRVAVSLPSIRADSLTATLMSQIKRVRKTGFTIAPEAGSQRLRDVINKSLTEQEIVSTVKNAIGLGWKVIKLYFMIGLPTETDADIVALISLVKKLRSLKSAENKRYNYNLHVSVATFIPKPHTPFQWSRQICLEESKAKIRMIKDALVKGCGVQVKWQNPEVSLIEGVFSRGDRTLSSLLVSAYRKGCRFDGWTDSFDFRKWKAAAEEIRLDLEGYATRTIAVDDPLAWDHIDLGIHPRYLKEELKKSESGMPTEDCRWGNCQNCGICDFKDVKPVVYDGYQGVFENIGETASEGEKWKKLFVSYQKVGSARFFGHLELVKIFSRAFHRAAIPMKYTEGFHPHPRLSFGNPLPVGMESLKEQVVITVEDAYDETRFESMVNPRLPEGLLVTGCSTYDDGPGERDSRLRFQIELNGDRFEQEKVDSFFESDVWLISRKSKRGKKRDIDIRKQVKGLRIIAPNRLSMEMVQDENGVAQPKEIIRSIFFLSEEAVMKARIMKRPGCRSEL